MRSSPLNVVLLDDDADTVEMLALVLQDQLPRATFRVFDDPRAALAAVLLHPPDVIVTDLEMPFLSGVELAAAVRDARSVASPPLLVAVSGNTAKLAGMTQPPLFDHSLQKPVDIDRLVQLLQARQAP